MMSSEIKKGSVINGDAANLLHQLEGELGVKGPANVLRAALKLAREAAAQAREAEPPAPPAWMVEVAREGCAQDCDAKNEPGIAVAYRAGRYDDAGSFASSINSLRLALERGHVFEPQEMGAVAAPVAPAVDLQGPMKRAWRAGFRNARAEVRTLLDGVQLGDKAEVICDRHVNDILSTLPTREA